MADYQPVHKGVSCRLCGAVSARPPIHSTFINAALCGDCEFEFIEKHLWVNQSIKYKYLKEVEIEMQFNSWVLKILHRTINLTKVATKFGCNLGLKRCESVANKHGQMVKRGYQCTRKASRIRDNHPVCLMHYNINDPLYIDSAPDAVLNPLVRVLREALETDPRLKEKIKQEIYKDCRI